jgi:hypothetical protein
MRVIVIESEGVSERLRFEEGFRGLRSAVIHNSMRFSALGHESHVQLRFSSKSDTRGCTKPFHLALTVSWCA